MINGKAQRALRCRIALNPEVGRIPSGQPGITVLTDLGCHSLDRALGMLACRLVRLADVLGGMQGDDPIEPVGVAQSEFEALPALNEQRRNDLAKQVKKRAEESKVAVRNVRRDVDTGLKKLEKDGKLSQDELKRALDRVQKLTDSSIKLVDEAADRKEKEVKEV